MVFILERHEWQLPAGFTQEQIDRYAAEQERKRRRQYNQSHPEIVRNQRIRAYANFLRRQGYFVMHAALPELPWNKDQERMILNAIRANAEGLRNE